MNDSRHLVLSDNRHLYSFCNRLYFGMIVSVKKDEARQPAGPVRRV